MTFPRSYLALPAGVLLIVGVLGLSVTESAAQNAETPAETAPPTATEGQPVEPAPATETEGQPAEAVLPSNAGFMKPLGRLSMILGSVHFLRTLCGDASAGVYRQRMGELLDAQSPNEADRRLLIANFNGGYRSFESTYRACTPAAQLAVKRYTDEGAALAREISARYGN